MPDLIRIVDLEVFARIGVPDEERREPQRLLVTAELDAGSMSHAASTDNLARAINYADVAERIRRCVAAHSRKLLERVAEEVAAELLDSYPIRKITLEVKKFILPDTQYVSVKIERERGRN